MAKFRDSYLKNPMDGGAWWAIVHGVAKSWTRLRTVCSHTHTHTHTHIPQAEYEQKCYLFPLAAVIRKQICLLFFLFCPLCLEYISTSDDNESLRRHLGDGLSLSAWVPEWLHRSQPLYSPLYHPWPEIPALY